jgi:predicted DNA-binding transcriptional regulator AlpA
MPAAKQKFPPFSPVQELARHPQWPNASTLECDAAPYGPTDLLILQQVEERTKMKRSNIYRLIQLGQFPAPIHLGGSKWIAAEVDEAIERLKEDRDRKNGLNKFVPRPVILNGQGARALSGSFSAGMRETSASQRPSTLRMLEPELCQALKMLKLDIPELYLDPAVWNVSLAVIKVELPPAQPTTPGPKRKRR